MPVNPVLRRELLERWRGRRATAILTAYLTVLSATLYLLYRLAVAVLESQMGFGSGPDSAVIGPALGRFLFDGLLFFILLFVLFVVPGYAAAQLSGERERRTLSLLQITLLHPHQIVLGKLGASVAWLGLLVVAALPLGAGVLFLGGVAIADLLRATIFILAISVAVAGIALCVSSLVRRTTAAVVLTYAVVLALTGGTAFLSLAEFVLRSQSPGPITTPMALYMNPFFGLADAARAVGPSGGSTVLPSPLGLIGEALPDAPAMRRGAFNGPVEAGEFDAAPPRPGGMVWLQVCGLYLLLGAGGVLIASRRVRTGRTPARRRAPPASAAAADAPDSRPGAVQAVEDTGSA